MSAGLTASAMEPLPVQSSLQWSLWWLALWSQVGQVLTAEGHLVHGAWCVEPLQISTSTAQRSVHAAGLVYRRRQSRNRLQRERKLGAAGLVSPDELHSQTSVKHLLQNSGSPDTSWSLDSQPSGQQAATTLATCGSGVQSEWRIWGLLSGSSIGSSGGWCRRAEVQAVTTSDSWC